MTIGDIWLLLTNHWLYSYLELENQFMHFTAIDIETLEIKDTEFMVPKKYKEISIEAMEKNLQDLKDI